VRRLTRIALLVALPALLLSAPAANAAGISPANRRAINATLDTFVNHAVKRQDVGAAYFVVTPNLRNGMSLKEWKKGDIPAYPYPARGTTFHQWTFSYRDGNELGINLMLMPRKGSKLGPYAFEVSLIHQGRRWLVDTFQPQATFAPTDAKTAKVTAVSDFAPGQPAEGEAGPTHISSKWAFVPFILLGVLLVVLAGAALVATTRNRRVMGTARNTLPPIPERFRSRR
jgi:hypothetical protein